MRRSASRKGDLPIDFIKRRVVIFLFFVEARLLNCINCNAVPTGTRNHSHEAALNSGLASVDSGLQADVRFWGSAGVSKGLYSLLLTVVLNLTVLESSLRARVGVRLLAISFC